MLGSLRRMVEEVEYELKYYKDSLDDATEVIAQLHRGYALPGKPTLIHPADLSELLNDATASMDYAYIFQNGVDKAPNNNLCIRGTTYKQSTHMPQITTKFR
jgi:hypothetical protein